MLPQNATMRKDKVKAYRDLVAMRRRSLASLASFSASRCSWLHVLRRSSGGVDGGSQGLEDWLLLMKSSSEEMSSYCCSCWLNSTSWLLPTSSTASASMNSRTVEEIFLSLADLPLNMVMSSGCGCVGVCVCSPK